VNQTKSNQIKPFSQFFQTSFRHCQAPAFDAMPRSSPSIQENSGSSRIIQEYSSIFSAKDRTDRNAKNVSNFSILSPFTMSFRNALKLEIKIASRNGIVRGKQCIGEIS